MLWFDSASSSWLV